MEYAAPGDAAIHFTSKNLGIPLRLAELEARARETKAEEPSETVFQ